MHVRKMRRQIAELSTCLKYLVALNQSLQAVPHLEKGVVIRKSLEDLRSRGLRLGPSMDPDRELRTKNYFRVDFCL